MSAEIKNRFTPTKLSVAVFAYCGNMADYVNTRVLLVKNSEGKVTPVAGKMETAEQPLLSLEREWNEETGGEPFTFKSGSLRFKDAVFVAGDGFIDIGFIYHARLTDSQIETFAKGKVITGDEDIVEAKLYDMDEVLVILRNWQTKLAHPEINAQTLINIVNNVMVNHDDFTASPIKDGDLFTLEYFGMNFKVNSLALGIDK